MARCKSEYRAGRNQNREMRAQPKKFLANAKHYKDGFWRQIERAPKGAPQ
jgi:hypothetical protein